jgi:dipeptidyl aminopeptidase/acylaminoacyl peptidase
VPDAGAALEYRPGRSATVLRPDEAPGAVVVLVPGGSWMSADPTGMRRLAGPLADAGLATVTITYGTWGSGDRHPVPQQDVACAVAFAATQVPGVPVVLLGHSAGAHLAALVGLVPEQGGACPHTARAADGVVGLAGPYDVVRTGGMAANLFGAGQDEDPQAWRDGNPLTWVEERPDVPFLLVHGEEDHVVPRFFSDDLGAALAGAGHRVDVVTYPGVDHLEVIEPDVVTDDVVRWVTDAVARP